MSDNKLAFYDFSGGINTNATKVMLGYGAKKLTGTTAIMLNYIKTKALKECWGIRHIWMTI